MKYTIPVVAVCLLSCFAAQSEDTRTPNDIDYSMYFNADIRDAEFCELTYSKTNKKYQYGKNVTNPAMTCPDAFSWQLFTQVVNDRFWSNWAEERANWPEYPYPLCSESESPAKNKCCTPGSASNNKEHCPTFPAKQYARTLKKLNHFSDKKAQSLLSEHSELIPTGRPSVLSAMRNKNLKAHGEITGTNICTPAQVEHVKRVLIPKSGYESKGRIIRQINSEVTVRNLPFHDYLFRNNLYNADGVLDVFENNNKNQQKNAPFHSRNQSVMQDTTATKAKLSTIDLPPDAIMIKSNWLYHEFATELGYPQDTNRYISKTLKTSVCLAEDKDPTSCNAKEKPENFCDIVGKHYLLAFHISSKDIPQWVWTTFEHVDNFGRCDFTGCNDAFGFNRKAESKDDVGLNYVSPKQRSDELNSPSIVYNRDLKYEAEEMSASLRALLKNTGIAQGQSTSEHEPDPEDSAWSHFRLKGSQVNFTDHMGHSTLLGNSITEGGFMQQSSCISCHSRAGVHKVMKEITADGETKQVKTADFFKLSVFERQLSDFGYQQSVHNVPKSEWFYNNNDKATLDVLQTDFIWGFLFASPLCTSESGEECD
ncbi:hypothetical protein [Pseudoalteromonas galatheae]|uniref:hypothetical protein n=1 Tax=Pseudoalteromonas galatheae TaxID=579562 RepID=UPI0030CDA902